ncbi:hypothetical protein J4216_06565 [Candidatus Woesearchaeota archaeon]|nr:hypothetical protein [Candidatus Woesearchaeota archaeon]
MAQSGAAAAGASGGIVSQAASPIIGPIAWLSKWLITIIIFVLVTGIILGTIFIGFKYISAKSQTGELASVAKHTGVQAEEEVLSPTATFVKKFSPDLYSVLYPERYNPYAIDSVVEKNTNEKIGVEILEFGPRSKFFRPNSPISLRGRIRVQGLDKPTKILTYCVLEDYKKEEPIGAQLLGTSASGNTANIFAKQATELVVNCEFPEGLSVEKQVTSKFAKLIVIYEFQTKAYQRIWALDRAALNDLESNGINPFNYYSIKDELLSSNGISRSKTTPGPVNLGLQVDFPQPITTGSRYDILVQLSRNLDRGNLQRLNYLRIQVPSAQDLSIDLEGEQGLGFGSRCDFEYIGETDEQYKEYELIASKIEETNVECDKPLIEFALDLDKASKAFITEQDCKSIFKEPTFTCNFILTQAPNNMQSDIIKAEAGYTYQVERSSVIDIKALPNEISQPNVA